MMAVNLPRFLWKLPKLEVMMYNPSPNINKIKEITKRDVLYAGIRGWLMEWEAYRLAELAWNRVVLELGCYVGRSTLTMAPFAKHIYCVDHFHPGENGQGYYPDQPSILPLFIQNTKKWARKIGYLKGTTAEALEYNWPPIGLLFIDANHTIKDILHDIKFAKFLEPRGIVALHDTEKPNVKEALAQSELINWYELEGAQTLRAFTRMRG